MESPYTWPRHSWVPFALILGAISIRPNYPQTNHNVENTYTPQQRIVCFSIADIQHPFIPLFYVLTLVSSVSSVCASSSSSNAGWDVRRYVLPFSSDFHIFNLTQWTNKFRMQCENGKLLPTETIWSWHPCFVSSISPRQSHTHTHTCSLTIFSGEIHRLLILCGRWQNHLITNLPPNVVCLWYE